MLNEGAFGLCRPTSAAAAAGRTALQSAGISDKYGVTLQEAESDMDMNTVIECACGHRIGLHELLSHGFVMVGEKPVYVYIKYRCAECGTEGMELLDYDKWNVIMRQPEEPAAEAEMAEHEHHRDLGRIGPEEIIEFARELAHLTYSQFADLYSN